MIMDFPTMKEEMLEISHDAYNQGAKDFQTAMVKSFSQMDLETVSKENIIKIIGSADTNALPVSNEK